MALNQINLLIQMMAMKMNQGWYFWQMATQILVLGKALKNRSVKRGISLKSANFFRTKILRRGVPPLICYACIPVFGTKIYAVEAGSNLSADGFCKNIFDTFTYAGFWNLYIPILLPWVLVHLGRSLISAKCWLMVMKKRVGGNISGGWRPRY